MVEYTNITMPLNIRCFWRFRLMHIQTNHLFCLHGSMQHSIDCVKNMDSLTITIATSASIGSLNPQVCYPIGILFIWITILWLSNGIWSIAVLNNLIDQWVCRMNFATIQLFLFLCMCWFNAHPYQEQQTFPFVPSLLLLGFQ